MGESLVEMRVRILRVLHYLLGGNASHNIEKSFRHVEILGRWVVLYILFSAILINTKGLGRGVL